MLFLMICVTIGNSYKNKIEKMTDVLGFNVNQEDKQEIHELIKEDLKEIVSNIYQVDIDSIRNLEKIATTLQKDGLTIPGDLTVKGKFNYLPKGTIVSYYSTQPPQGWALCDGKTVNGLKTPDLRGRFIMGVTNESGFKLNNYGGSKKINRNNLPNFTINTNNDGTHTHNMPWKWKDNYYERKYAENKSYAFGPISAHSQATHGGTYDNIMKSLKSKSGHEHQISFTGGNRDYLQPYYALTYIIKL